MVMEAAAEEEAQCAAAAEARGQSIAGLAEAAVHRQSSLPASVQAQAVWEGLRRGSRQARAGVPSRRLSTDKDRNPRHEPISLQ
jgi:hypothetical protein